MIWKVDGIVQKTPDSYKIQADDMDKDSYRSVVNGSLIDTVIAKAMHSCQFEFIYNSEAEAEALMQLTFKNPMNVWIKSPVVKGGVLEAPFRCSKRSIECYKTDITDETSKSKWRVSFNIVQKKKVSGQ